jgi:hypothetical protein
MKFISSLISDLARLVSKFEPSRAQVLARYDNELIRKPYRASAAVSKRANCLLAE